MYPGPIFPPFGVGGNTRHRRRRVACVRLQPAAENDLSNKWDICVFTNKYKYTFIHLPAVVVIVKRSLYPQLEKGHTVLQHFCVRHALLPFLRALLPLRTDARTRRSARVSHRYLHENCA